jgi:hypothetical protein
MDATAFLDTVRESNATELDRLGSEKALVAETTARLDREHVLEAAAAAEARAAETFALWADDETNDRAASAFRDAADSEREHYRQVAELGATAEEPPADALHEHLRTLEATCPRIASGLVARPLVASRTLLQVINFFVNEGRTGAAETFRALRAETDETADRGAALVADLCGAESERATRAASETIEVAYEEYANTLEGMGVDPKPVC